MSVIWWEPPASRQQEVSGMTVIKTCNKYDKVIISSKQCSSYNENKRFGSNNDVAISHRRCPSGTCSGWVTWKDKMSLLPHGCTRVIIKLCEDCQRYEEHVPQKSAIYKVILGGSIGLVEVSEAIYQKHIFLNQIKKKSTWGAEK